ncbi:MAG: endonuclease/exonuclease/phosphatase family protein [Longimicrobiales bacterium]
MEKLAPWRLAVGPTLTHVPSGGPDMVGGPNQTPDRLTVVVWNARVGGGALGEFWRQIQAEAQGGPIVLLLQEVFASGGAIPTPLPTGATCAGLISDSPPAEARTDVLSFAVAAGLTLAYVPSMRNGPGPEDRGNALLANVPLSQIHAVELPFERQRRVAVVGTVEWGGLAVRVCSVHLDNRAPWRRAWRSLGAARGRQMAGLLDQFGADTAERQQCSALGGDFNTWVGGTGEQAYRLARSRFPDPGRLDPRGTHHFEIGSVLRRSDHLLFSLPEGWRAEVRRLDDTFGSDHYPLLGTISKA